MLSLQAASKGHRIFAEIDAFAFAEFFGEVVDELFIKVIAAQVGVAVDRENFKHAIADIKGGNVERSAAQVEDENFFVLLFVQAILPGRRAAAAARV